MKTILFILILLTGVANLLIGSLFILSNVLNPEVHFSVIHIFCTLGFVVGGVAFIQIITEYSDYLLSGVPIFIHVGVLSWIVVALVMLLQTGFRLSMLTIPVLSYSLLLYFNFLINSMKRK